MSVTETVDAVFSCNICGQENEFNHDQNKKVPGQLCSRCGSSTRFRLITFAISKHVFGGSGELFKDARTGMVGIGLSDAPPIANAIKKNRRLYQHVLSHAAEIGYYEDLW